MSDPLELKEMLNEESMEYIDGADFDYETAARYCISTFLMCIKTKDIKGCLKHSGGLIALDIELEYLKLSPQELNWVVGALMT